VTPGQALAVAAAGLVAGSMNAVVGAGSLVSFPVLLWVGLPSVTANVSNTLGLIPASVAGAYGYRHRMTGLWPLVGRLAVPAVLGGLSGAALLLLLPAEAFAALVPVLLLLAAALVAVQPRLTAWLSARAAARGGLDADVDSRAHATVGVVTWTFLVAVYGGYFGAAMGVLMLAVYGALLGGLQAANGVKNVLAAVINLTAAVVFALVADVDWAAAGLLAVGSTVGGLVGSRYGRGLPELPLRVAVVVLAVVVAVQQILT
jgi:uncharacterized membrane protein YfcA